METRLLARFLRMIDRSTPEGSGEWCYFLVNPGKVASLTESTMKPANSFHTARILRAVLAATFAHVTHGVADTLYWDTNGAAPGSGNAGGSWNADNWSASIAGDEATQAWVGGRNAVFSAGTDGTAARTVTISGTIATPSILLKEAGLVTLSGGAIDITGGAVFDTSVLGTAGGRQLTWSSSITGAGPLTLAAHGSTSDSGDNSNSFILLDGLNDFTGDGTSSCAPTPRSRSVAIRVTDTVRGNI